MPLTPQDFVSKWKRVTAREKQLYQQHFLDVCELVGHPALAALQGRVELLPTAELALNTMLISSR